MSVLWSQWVSLDMAVQTQFHQKGREVHWNQRTRTYEGMDPITFSIDTLISGTQPTE